MNNISSNNVMKLDDSTEIVSLKLIDINTQKEYLAEVKPNNRTGKMSKCHSFEDIETQTHIIKLRLDWSDTINGEPKLDANIWDKNTGRQIPIKEQWHHTIGTLDPTTNKTIYKFEFMEYKAILTTIKDVCKKMNDKISLDDKVKFELKKGDF